MQGLSLPARRVLTRAASRGGNPAGGMGGTSRAYAFFSHTSYFVPLPDPYDCIEIDDEGRAHLKQETKAVEWFMKGVAGCPSDNCPPARVCQIECRTFNR